MWRGLSHRHRPGDATCLVNLRLHPSHWRLILRKKKPLRVVHTYPSTYICTSLRTSPTKHVVTVRDSSPSCSVVYASCTGKEWVLTLGVAFNNEVPGGRCVCDVYHESLQTTAVA